MLNPVSALTNIIVVHVVYISLLVDTVKIRYVKGVYILTKVSRVNVTYYQMECPICGRIFIGETRKNVEFQYNVHMKTVHKQG